ncbi:MAG: response regulator transcription factor [Ardenticatenaceae bacterium]|nr:response regulator transcription factor [Ardenticatenaceae bacterium]
MIRILLGHPSRLVCDSLRTALDNVDDVYVVGCATKAEELHFLLPHGNVVLIGTELEDTTALEMMHEIRMTHPNVKIMVIGLDDNPDVILRHIEAGAAGYILQNESIVEMVEKLHAANEEKAIISPAVAAAMMDRLAHLANLDTPLAYLEARETQLDELTSREEEVLGLINDGLTNQEIAERLYIECGTVKNHVHKILKKLDVNNRQEAAYVLQSFQRPAPAMAMA